MPRAGRLALAMLLLLASAAPVAAERLRLVVESAFAPRHVPILLGIVRGDFARADIEMVVEPSLGGNMAAVLVGQRAFELGHLGTTAAAIAIANGAPIRVVAVYQPRTALALVGLRGRVRLDGPKSVEGLRVGITPGTNDSMALALFRSAQNIGSSALTIMPVDQDAKLPDLIAGRLDLVLADAAAMRASLLPQDQEPVELDLADNGVPLQGFGFIASQALLGSNSDLARRALATIRAGFTAAAADPLAACRAVRDSYPMPGSDQTCAATLAIFLTRTTPPATVGWGRQSGEAWQRMIAAMRAVGEIRGTRPTSFYFTNSVAP